MGAINHQHLVIYHWFTNVTCFIIGVCSLLHDTMMLRHFKYIPKYYSIYRTSGKKTKKKQHPAGNLCQNIQTSPSKRSGRLNWDPNLNSWKVVEVRQSQPMLHLAGTNTLRKRGEWMIMIPYLRGKTLDFHDNSI